MSGASNRFPRRVGIVAGFLALAALPAVGVGAFAAAATGSGEASAAGTPLPLSDTQQHCLTDHGVTLPATGERPQGLTDEQRAAFRAAAHACGITLPAHRPRLELSDAQKQCLAGHGVTLPARPVNGERPAPPTDEQRAALHAAAEACGISLPAHRPRLELSDAQKQCLTGHGVTLPARPVNGERPAPPTDEQRAALHAAAQACGITLPAFGDHRPDQGGTPI